MNYYSFIPRLIERLRQPLPGVTAQMSMSSNVRIRELMTITHTEPAVQSSVLMLLYPRDEDIMTVFMLRPQYGGIHSGQISLPGGKFETQDADLVQTALRESREEVGIDPASVKIAGKLTDLYIPPSNYIVSPYIGYTDKRPRFVIDPVEVEKIIEVTLDQLFDPRSFEVRRFTVREEFEVEAPCFVPGGNVIWGATAMMLSEFRELYREITDPEHSPTR